MCVICVKPKGIEFPTIENLEQMWNKNPDGAGFMFARNNEVVIRKGFMDLYSFIVAMNDEKLTKDDVVVMHFRISTQAGINEAMTHPFPLSADLNDMKELDCLCEVGIAHNGIIRLTSNPMEKNYSDTALFVSNYLTRIIRKDSDIHDEYIKDIIYQLAQSKLAILNRKGELSLIGHFEQKENGLWYSNLYHEPNHFAFYERDNFKRYYNSLGKKR